MNDALMGMLFKAFPPEMIVEKLVEKFGPELQQGFDFVKNINAVATEFLASQQRIEAQQREILALLKGELINGTATGIVIGDDAERQAVIPFTNGA